MNGILTLDNLYEFCLKNKVEQYNASTNNGLPLIVHTYGVFDEQSEDQESGDLKVQLKACHIGLNRNDSFISKDVMETALPSFSNRPILAHIIQTEDGTYDFDQHNIEIINDPWHEGEKRVQYIEQPIGIIPESCNAHLAYDEEADKTYVVVNGIIYNDYSNGAVEIMKSKQSTKVSVEIGINEMSFNAKEKYLDIKDFSFMGVTALGEHVKEGMLGSEMSVIDNSFDNSKSVFSSEEFINKFVQNIISSLNTTLVNNINTIKKGGNESVQELLNKYNKTMEDITFEYEGLSDEELAAKFEEVFGSEGEEKFSKVCPECGATIEDDSATVCPECGASLDEDPEDKEDPEDMACGGGSGGGSGKKKKKNSLEATLNGKTYSIDLSLEEKFEALSILVNDTYGETDATFYCVDVYDNYVVMIDYFNRKAYKQSYVVNNNDFSFTGDRVEVFSNWLTKEEENSVANMRTRFSELSAELEKYENREKETILNDECYSAIKEFDDFKVLVENAAKYSINDLRSKADTLLGTYGRMNKFTYHEKNHDKNKVDYTIDSSKKSKTYGDLFDHEK